jgi:hypothetical protein
VRAWERIHTRTCAVATPAHLSSASVQPLHILALARHSSPVTCLIAGHRHRTPSAPPPPTAPPPPPTAATCVLCQHPMPGMPHGFAATRALRLYMYTPQGLRGDMLMMRTKVDSGESGDGLQDSACGTGCSRLLPQPPATSHQCVPPATSQKQPSTNPSRGCSQITHHASTSVCHLLVCVPRVASYILDCTPGESDSSSQCGWRCCSGDADAEIAALPCAWSIVYSVSK